MPLRDGRVVRGAAAGGQEAGSAGGGQLLQEGEAAAAHFVSNKVSMHFVQFLGEGRDVFQ